MQDKMTTGQWPGTGRHLVFIGGKDAAVDAVQLAQSHAARYTAASALSGGAG